MRFRLTTPALILVSAALCLFPAAARAGCSVAAADLPFGGLSVSSFQGAATGVITLTCPPGLPTDSVGLCVRIAGDGANRTMKNAAGSSMVYGLYHDAAYAIPWLGASESVFVAAPYDRNAGALIQQPLYAKIRSQPAGMAQGDYSDAIATQAIIADSGYDGVSNVCALASGATMSLMFNATARLQPSCTVNATDMVFPTGPTPTTSVAATASLNIVCTGATSYEVALSPGSGAGATVAARRLTGPGGATVAYSLFRDAAYRQVWGDTPGARASGLGAGGLQTLTVYGLAPPQPMGAPGRYTDVINVTVIY